MIAPAPTRDIVRKLRTAGFAKRDAKGSHTLWSCPSGRHVVSIAEGHKTTSPGVHRTVLRTIAACDCREDQP